MKTIFLPLLAIALLAGCVVIGWTQRKTIVDLQEQKQTLLKQNTEISRLADENSQLPKLREQHEEIQRLQAENQDLYKLRNEIGQLHNSKTGLDRLRVENAYLVEAKKKLATNFEQKPTLPGFIPKSALVDAGVATPEATLQTFFWAYSRGDIDGLRKCVSVDIPDDKAKKEEAESSFKDFPGFAVTSKEYQSPTNVLLQIKTSLNGTVLPVRLNRIGDEWKVDGF